MTELEMSENEWDEEPVGYESIPTLRPEGYYDLIELPNGRHIPAPIAERLVGEAIVEMIPRSRKQRDERFFYCPACDEDQTRFDNMFLPQKLIIPKVNGYSFFRCKTHKPTTKEENDAKESMLVRLIINGMYRTLRYVEAQS